MVRMLVFGLIGECKLWLRWVMLFLLPILEALAGMGIILNVQDIPNGVRECSMI